MANPQQETPVAPTRRLNFQHNGSDLYDSFELKQMTYQLNKAIIQTSNASSSSPADHQLMKHKDQLSKAFQSSSNSSSQPYIFHLNSPLYQRQLNFLYRESTRTPRGISGPQVPGNRVCPRGTREGGFVTRLWVKVKGLFGKEH